MRLVVIDTNVVISAGLNRAGVPGKLIDLVLDGRVQTLVSPVIITEYRSISRRPKFADCDFPPQWLELLISTSLELPDQSKWPHRLPDPDDSPLSRSRPHSRSMAGHRKSEALSRICALWCDRHLTCGLSGASDRDSVATAVNYKRAHHRIRELRNRRSPPQSRVEPAHLPR